MYLEKQMKHHTQEDTKIIKDLFFLFFIMNSVYKRLQLQCSAMIISVQVEVVSLSFEL